MMMNVPVLYGYSENTKKVHKVVEGMTFEQCNADASRKAKNFMVGGRIGNSQAEVEYQEKISQGYVNCKRCFPG